MVRIALIRISTYFKLVTQRVTEDVYTPSLTETLTQSLAGPHFPTFFLLNLQPMLFVSRLC